METLNMKPVQLEKECVIISMPVNEKTHQPMGFLHGGASVALAETAASIGAFLNIDSAQYNVFGMEINANHIKAKRTGEVTGIAKPVHIGRNSMVWQIEIVDEQEILICTSRCTIGIVPKDK